MVLWNIEGLEIVIVVFDIRAPCNFETHSPENIDDLVNHKRQRMNPAPFQACSRQRNIDFRFSQNAGLQFLLNNVKPFIESLFQNSFDLVELFPRPRSLFRGQILQPSQEKCQSTLAAQKLHAQLFNLRLGGRLLESLQNLSLESFERFVHLNYKLGVEVGLCGLNQLSESRHIRDR